MEDIALEILLLNWFTNTRLNHENNAVLLISSSLVFNTSKMINLLKKFNTTIACHVNDLSSIKSISDPYKYFRANVGSSFKVEDNELNQPVKNFIFFVDHSSITKIQSLIEIFRAYNKQIIFINGNIASEILHKKFENHCNDKKEPEVLPTHSNYYLDNYKSDPVILVTDDVFKQSMQTILQYRIEFISSLGVQFYRTNYEQITKNINTDIELLKHKNVLTSNLAMHIYHLTFLLAESNPTKSGNYFRDNLGIKSKTFSKDSKKIKNFLLSTSKSFKAYDLSIDMKKQIKLDIASKLIRFIKSNPNKDLDVSSIATITEISVKDVEELFDTYKRPKTIAR
jgi:hypothetical protein